MFSLCQLKFSKLKSLSHWVTSDAAESRWWHSLSKRSKWEIKVFDSKRYRFHFPNQTLNVHVAISLPGRRTPVEWCQSAMVITMRSLYGVSMKFAFGNLHNTKPDHRREIDKRVPRLKIFRLSSGYKRAPVSTPVNAVYDLQRPVLFSNCSGKPFRCSGYSDGPFRVFRESSDCLQSELWIFFHWEVPPKFYGLSTCQLMAFDDVLILSW